MELATEKRGHFLYRLFCQEEILLKICVLSQCIVYWIHFQNMHTFTYQKTLFHTLLLLVFKIVKSFQCNIASINTTNTTKIMWIVLPPIYNMYTMTPLWKPCINLHTVMTNERSFVLTVAWIPLPIHFGFMIGCV